MRAGSLLSDGRTIRLAQLHYLYIFPHCLRGAFTAQTQAVATRLQPPNTLPKSPKAPKEPQDFLSIPVPNFLIPQIPQLSSSSCISVSDNLVVHSIFFSSYQQWHPHHHGSDGSSTGLPLMRAEWRLYQWAKADITYIILTKAQLRLT